MPSPVSSDEHLVSLAQSGDMSALNALIRQHQPWVFNLALRMVWRRDVAEDATQEILVKAVTHLGSFEGRSKFSTWLHRIAINHLLNVQKSEMEQKAMTFTDMGASLDEVIANDLPHDAILFVEEARLGCITAMLMCLDRRQRLAFILGEVMGEDSATSAAAMEIKPDHFRQLLSRARRDLYQFMNEKCGLVNKSNPCRCARKASGFMQNGWLDPANLQFTKDRIAKVEKAAPDHLRELEALDQQHASLYRDQPMLSGPDIASRLRDLIEGTGFAKT
ncbi:MAG: RNA polymerase sigma factor [Verrucomicrobiaceae bacterium]|nr:RNA polymerase sigma factor [Verrucomicrobiaceae bacterium]